MCTSRMLCYMARSKTFLPDASGVCASKLVVVKFTKEGSAALLLLPPSCQCHNSIHVKPAAVAGPRVKENSICGNISDFLQPPLPSCIYRTPIGVQMKDMARTTGSLKSKLG